MAALALTGTSIIAAIAALFQINFDTLTTPKKLLTTTTSFEAASSLRGKTK
jgi:hypothetical protein